MTIAVLARRAASDMRQHLGTQIMTTVVVSLSLLIVVFFSFIYFNLQHFVERFGSELGLVIFLKEGTPQDRIPEFYQKLTQLPEVESVKYVSPEEAFKRLESYLAEEREILEGVSPQFLPPSFELQVNRAVFNLDRISEIAGEITQWPEVSKVQYGQEWINRLAVFSRAVKIVVIVSGALLLLTAAFVVASTIKLTVYARQEELEILRLAGATNGFITAPFLIEAFLQGFVGSTFAVGILFLGHKSLGEVMAQVELLRGVTLSFLPWPFALTIIASSVLLCLLGTALAMQRFLRL
jgi:cell division transport system permease protein